MRKTKREKLMAAARRQKEFERIKFVQESTSKPKEEVRKVSEVPTPFKMTSGDFIPKDLTQTLTDLSYLPTQLIKIGLITGALILIQVLISLLIL